MSIWQNEEAVKIAASTSSSVAQLLTNPPVEEILSQLETKSYSEYGKELNISDNAIRKHLRSLGVEPPRKHVRFSK